MLPFRALIPVLALCPLAAGDVVNLNPVADAFLDSAQPGNNFGGAGALSIAAPGLPRGQFQTLLRFDASAAVAAFNASMGAGQWTIQSVSLRLTAALPNNPIFNPQAPGQFSASWMQNDTWIEGSGGPGNPSTTGVTFNDLAGLLSAGDQPLGTYAFAGGTSGNNTYAFTLAPSLAADIAAGGAVGLRLFAADAVIAYVFNSNNFGIPANRPVLSITAIPAPGAALLLLAALPRRRRSEPQA